MGFIPLCLVPKKDPGEFRLSFPKKTIVNSHADPEFSTVSFEVLDDCIHIVVQLGQGCLVVISDLQEAFRISYCHEQFNGYVFTRQKYHP